MMITSNRMAKIDIKKIFSPKQKYAESLIRRYAIYSDKIDEAKIAPTLSIFDPSKLEYIHQESMPVFLISRF